MALSYTSQHISLQHFLFCWFLFLFFLTGFIFWYKYKAKTLVVQYNVMKVGPMSVCCVCVVMTSSCPCFACLEGLHLGNPRPLLCYVVSFNYRLTLWSDCGKMQCLITLSTNKERRRQWRKYLFQFKRDTAHIKYLLIILLWIRNHFMRHFLRVKCLVE